MTTIQPSNNSELQLYRVLHRANLLKYFETFISQGGDDVHQLCEAGEDEFLEIMALVGMASKPLHVRRLQKALQEWVANPAAFEVVKKYPTHIMSITSKSSLSVTTVHSLETPDDSDDNVIPPQSSALSASTPCRSQIRDASSSDGSNFDDPNFSDSQLGDYKDTVRDYLVDQTYSGMMGMPDPRLTEHQVTAIAIAASRLAKDLPPLEPKSVSKKPTCQEILTVMQMSIDDPHRMTGLRKYAAIYGRFDSRRKNDKPMNMHEISVNEAAAQLCSHCPALLTRREELFPLARQVVRDSGYQYSKGHSRAADILLQSKLEMSDTVLSTLHTATMNHEGALTDLEAELSQVTMELAEITKEQNSIRSCLRVLLESNDHERMRKLTAEMDILNDRQTAMMKKRQKIKNTVAKCSKAVLGTSPLPESDVRGAPFWGQLSTNSTSNIAHITGSGCYGYNIELVSGNPLNTLYLAALQNQKDSLFEEGLRIAKQYGMSDFAEELIGMKSTTENVGNQQDSGNTVLPVGIVSSRCPPHKTASVSSTSSPAAATSSSLSLLLEYSMSGCRQCKDSSSSSSTSQAVVSSASSCVYTSAQHSLSTETTVVVAVSDHKYRHKHATKIIPASEMFPYVAGDPPDNHCVDNRCSDPSDNHCVGNRCSEPPDLDSSRESYPTSDDDSNVVEGNCTPQPVKTKKRDRMADMATPRRSRWKNGDTDYHSVFHAEKHLCSGMNRWSRSHSNDNSRMLSSVLSTAALTSSASV